MGVLDRIAERLGYVPRAQRSTGFAAAEVSRLTASLAHEARYINDILRHDLRALRARSRQASRNNPYGRRFVKMFVANVGGPQPFMLQSKVKYASGKFDTTANQRIESAWRGWSEPGHCEITGRWSWNALQRQILQVFATDGEIILRKLKGPEHGPFGVMFQLIDTDRLDESKNASLANGGAIHMGVEVDAQSRPVAYHLLKRLPSSWNRGGFTRDYERVPAEEIVHLFVPEFGEQVRGIPPMYAALLNLVHIGAFAEAAVIAARIGASQMGFIETQDGGKALADGQAKSADGVPQFDVAPGLFHLLPANTKLSGWNPQYPDAAVEPFMSAMLHGLAVGFDVAHHNLSGDLRGVNYSSARIGELDERDAWLILQNYFIEHLHTPFFNRDWLPMQVLTGRLPFELARLDKYRAAHFQGRRWTWVDPMKEVQAAQIAIRERLRSRTAIVAEAGEDFEDVLDEVAAEEQMAADKKVTLPKAEAGTPVPAVTANNGDDNEDS